MTKDNVMAYMWSDIAARAGIAAAAKTREIVTKKMTGAQITDAKRMSREWKPKKQAPP